MAELISSPATTGTCWGVVSLGSSSVSSLMLTSSQLLIAGLSNGGIHSLSVKTLWPSSHELTNATHNLSPVIDICSNSSLHNTVSSCIYTPLLLDSSVSTQISSLHADGTIAIWDLAQSKCCCQLALPPGYASSSSLTTCAQCTLMIAQEESANIAEPVTALFCWGLGTAEPLRRLWLEQTQEEKEDKVDDKAGPFDNLLLKKGQEERCVRAAASSVCVISSFQSPSQ